MDKIVIDKKIDVIIIEKSTGNDILRGSKLFCGLCGNPLGEVIELIGFPFTADRLDSCISDKTYSSTKFGLYHKTCGHSMFFGTNYRFMTMGNYLKEIKKVKI